MITLRQAQSLAPSQRKQVMVQINAALKRNRKDVDALLSAAAIHYVAKRIRMTVDMLKRAYAQQPKNLMIVQWLAVSAGEIRDYKTALIVSQQLVKLDPKNPENWNIRGTVLDGAGDPAGALEAFEQQKALAGEHPELVFQIGNCHFYMGDHDKALATYRHVLKLEPTHAMALYAISTIHRFQDDEVKAYIEDVEAAIAANGHMPDYNIAALLYGAGKAHDDIKDHDAAFDWYRKANEYRRPENTERLSHQFDNARAAFNPTYMQQREKWGDATRKPVFILGMPRSGTTLVESLIAAHPKMTAGGELPTLSDIALQIGAFQAPTDEFVHIAQKLTRADIKDMAKTYVEGARSLCGVGDHFTDKMPHNFMMIGLALLLFPNAKIIHCKRNPIDTCVSIYTNGMTPAHTYYKSDLATLGEYYNHYLDLMAYWHKVFPGRILDVYYEDVTVNTEINARRMIEFCDLKWHDDVVARESSQNAVRTLSAWQVRQPIYTTADGKWRRYEKHLGPLIDALGESVDNYAKHLDDVASKEFG